MKTVVSSAQLGCITRSSRFLSRYPWLFGVSICAPWRSTLSFFDIFGLLINHIYRIYTFQPEWIGCLQTINIDFIAVYSRKDCVFSFPSGTNHHTTKNIDINISIFLVYDICVPIHLHRYDITSKTFYIDFCLYNHCKWFIISMGQTIFGGFTCQITRTS